MKTHPWLIPFASLGSAVALGIALLYTTIAAGQARSGLVPSVVGMAIIVVLCAIAYHFNSSRSMLRTGVCAFVVALFAEAMMVMAITIAFGRDAWQ